MKSLNPLRPESTTNKTTLRLNAVAFRLPMHCMVFFGSRRRVQVVFGARSIGIRKVIGNLCFWEVVSTTSTRFLLAANGFQNPPFIKGFSNPKKGYTCRKEMKTIKMWQGLEDESEQFGKLSRNVIKRASLHLRLFPFKAVKQ